MSQNLLIVESPAKAKTIEKILGKDFKVTSCFGHIRDLSKENLGIDIENNFAPHYEVSKDKKEVVANLKKMKQDATKVWLATDEDREGEAISWHLCEVLDLDPATTNRIVFHEITPPAIRKAVAHPRHVNIDLVNAQQARRLLDRLVGFELSPVLWRKISNSASLSAGRVQSVALRLIVEREKDILNFEPQAYFKVSAIFIVKDSNGNPVQLKASSEHRFADEKAAQAFLEQCKKSTFSVADLQVKPLKRKPAAPFTTSTLQQDASRKYGFSVSKTMTLAQRLYEAGKITYMRTDSVTLSDTALAQAAETVTARYGKQYVENRQYITKSKEAQEAHEAIRPTDFSQEDAGASTDEKKLYSLIWKRALASQMKDALLEKTTVKIAISEVNDTSLLAEGEVIKFDGFLKLYRESIDEDEDNQEEQSLLPPLHIGQALSLSEMNARQRFTRPAARYNEATLVKQLEELGIGRPSTYAPTINTITKRKYVVRESRTGETREYINLQLADNHIARSVGAETVGNEKNKLFPTDMGILVNDFLVEYFANIVDYDFTAKMEEEFDQIALGKSNWVGMLRDFYYPFKQDISQISQDVGRVTGERILGIDPKTGKDVIAKMGKYGPIIQIGKAGEEEKPQFAKLLSNQSINSISLEEALPLFKLPRLLGTYDGKPVQANEGKYGPYVVHEGTFASIPAEISVMDINLQQAVELIKAKRTQAANQTIKEFSQDAEIKVLNGRYGPYIKAGKKNVRIPKDVVPEELTYQEVVDIIQQAPPPKAKFSKSKK
ncbi:MAG: type I DNA topoisomerase [Chitinophagales bacterium]|nr:type I DNA topoisomerase [Bacteroidota bacterium]MCB9043811.1 type I DNA topoisomerase [Chitinophagales bacterium]